MTLRINTRKARIQHHQDNGDPGIIITTTSGTTTTTDTPPAAADVGQLLSRSSAPDPGVVVDVDGSSPPPPLLLEDVDPGLSDSSTQRRHSSSSPSQQQQQRNHPLDVQLQLKKQNQNFVTITFLGDTMLGNVHHSWEFEDDKNKNRTLEAAFVYLKPLLTNSDFIIVNLEGPISTLPLKSSPTKRSFRASFGMTPRVATILRNELGGNHGQRRGVAACGANNHAGDRDYQGLVDTKRYLAEVGIPYFGNGLTPHQQAQPLIIELQLPDAIVGTQGRQRKNPKISITGFLEGGQLSDIILDPNNNSKNSKGNKRQKKPKQIHSTLRPENITDVNLSLQVLKQRLLFADTRGDGSDGDKSLQSTTTAEDDHDNVFKIAFPHWIKNYEQVKDNTINGAAKTLANNGFDMIIGSAGSHTVQKFDYIMKTTTTSTSTATKIPCLYDIGNFAFMNPEKLIRREMPGERSYYGSVTHLVLEYFEETLRAKEFIIHCIHHNQEKVHYQPRPCTPEQSHELFRTLGPYVQYQPMKDIVAKIDLTSTKHN